jgi:hypothetical protein
MHHQPSGFHHEDDLHIAQVMRLARAFGIDRDMIEAPQASPVYPVCRLIPAEAEMMHRVQTAEFGETMRIGRTMFDHRRFKPAPFLLGNRCSAKRAYPAAFGGESGSRLPKGAARRRAEIAALQLETTSLIRARYDGHAAKAYRLRGSGRSACEGHRAAFATEPASASRTENPVPDPASMNLHKT